jgi:4-hydroxy-4-methyl-2-oxoglutarate aldolase
MIGDPVALTIRRTIERPDPSLLDAFRNAPTGFITDAFNGQGCLDHRIKPLLPGTRVCGPALTCLCAPTDLLAAMASLDYARQGDVIVIAAKGDETAAVIGDRWAYWAKRIGVAGVVVDGLARDLAGLVDVGLPIFARGICPNSGFKNGPGEINTRVSCGGIAIEPGDVIVGDQDGVIAIPRSRAADVAAQLKLVEQREATLDAELRRADQAKFWNEEAARACGGIRFLDPD